MLSAKEREIRRHQLGASEIYKILNFDTQECQDLWELKIGLQNYQDIDNEAIEAGNILEEDCLKYYEKTTNKVLIYNERIEHPKIKGLVVSMDAREKETSIPVENKVVNEKTWDKWKAKRVFNAEYEGQKLNIPKKGNQYLSGKRDLFGLVIAFRYLLPKQDFLEFKRELIGIINKYIKNSGQISESSLLDIMGFPANWKDITRYRI